METLEHLRDRVILVTPMLPGRFVNVSKIQAIPRPYPHFIRGPGGNSHETAELRHRLRLLAETLGDIRRNGFGRPADLVRQGILLDLRKVQARPMNLQRHSIGPLEDL